MRRGVEALAQTARVRRRIVEDADERFVTLRQRPGRSEFWRRRKVFGAPALFAGEALAPRGLRQAQATRLCKLGRALSLSKGGGRKAPKPYAPGFRRIGAERPQLLRAWPARVEERARVGFGIGARLDQQQAPQHRLGRAQPGGHVRVRLGCQRVFGGDRFRRAEQHVQHPQKRLRRAPEGERGVANGGGWGGGVHGVRAMIRLVRGV